MRGQRSGRRGEGVLGCYDCVRLQGQRSKGQQVPACWPAAAAAG